MSSMLRTACAGLLCGILGPRLDERRSGPARSRSYKMTSSLLLWRMSRASQGVCFGVSFGTFLFQLGYWMDG